MNRKILSGSSVKLIAMSAMLIDHFGVIVLKNGFMINAPYSFFSDKEFEIITKLVSLCNIIGTLAFPLFCFLLVEGFVYTKNLKKYMINLAVFPVISEPIYDWTLTDKVVNLDEQNVIFTLLLGLVTLFIIKKLNKHIFLITLTVLTSSLLSYLLRLDGWYYGILMISTFYILRDKHYFKYLIISLIMFICTLTISVSTLWDPYFLMSLVSLVVIFNYNGQRGMNLKYSFYWFYPVHLLLLKVVSVALIHYYF